MAEITAFKIKGIILQPFYPNSLFEGFLNCKEDGTIDGYLNDRWGQSKIEGILKNQLGDLTFRKMYIHRADIIFYSFKKEGNLWIGCYNGPETGVGEAQCEIYAKYSKIDWNKRLQTETFSMKAAQAYSRHLIEKMIEQGFVREIEDPQTGEKLLELTEKVRFDPSNN
ncbi:MAG: hypothetical protein QXD13_00995 [Candidatus Pacearchaeota archaeon]